MRRKSERNKAKASPEKKVEKPTRKSTRRRTGRKSPSTTPEPEVVSQKTENVAQVERNVEKEVGAPQTRAQCSEIEKIEKTEKIEKEEVNEEKVSSTGKDGTEREKEEEEDAGSVWKVARADASPGEIQKLKLCRQRNTSEALSDSRRKESNDKWQECGEGVAGEVDSAEEQLVSCGRMPSGEEPNDPSSSSYPGQESKQEEVSDSKDLLPETTSANLLSDDKPNIDRQGDACQADDKLVSERKDISGDIQSPPKPASSNGELEDKDSGSRETGQDDLPNLPNLHNLPNPKEEDVDSRKDSDTANPEEKQNTSNTSTDDDNDNDDEEDKNIPKSNRRSSSESNDEREKTKIPTNVKTPSRATRRKHRNKYGDSSNSDSPDSEDESRNSVKQKLQEPNVLHEETKEEEKDEGKSEDNTKERRSEEKLETIVECEENDEKTSPQVSIGKIQETKQQQATQPAPKPAKVNLKRSFAARISSDNNEVKKDDTSVNNDTASQDKENHADVEQESKFVPKRRRWGTALSTDSAPAFSISTESLKALVPGAKPLAITEVRLSKDDDDEREGRRSQEKRRDSSDSAGERKMDEQKNGAVKKDGKMDNHIAARRKISIVKETSHMKSPSPSVSKPTNILLIKNLVRPFTLNQIKELLSRTGSIVENGFWMDRIKSKCFVEYSNEDQAFETRQALHGISWPLSNPKRLQVEYATKEEMEQVRESSKEQTIARKPEGLTATTATTDAWQQDWTQERTNSTKVTVVREWDLGKEDGQAPLKDKEKKEHDKKRRQRSRSPGMEAHLPAPARKFKKKEDEPPPAKLLDDLFRKTKSTPCIYWLPLTNEQIVVKEEMRRQHMAEHARRMEEMRRAERNRDGRRRRSPRK